MSLITTLATEILTVVPELQLGQIQISADRRSTKENKLSDAERIRRAILPANHWGEFSALLNGEKSQGLTDILREALKQLASDRLKDSLAAEPQLKTIDLADYNVSNLLKWSTETAASRGSITFTRDEVTNWFAGSATAANIKTKHGDKAEAILSFLSNRYGALAAKNHGLKVEAEAIKLMVLIADADTDAASPAAALVAEIVGRLDSIAKQLKAKAAEASISLDDI